MLVVCAGILVAVVVQDDRPGEGHAVRAETLRESLSGVIDVATRCAAFWPIFLIHIISYSSFVIIVGLWGGPYLTHVYGYGLTSAANVDCWSRCGADHRGGDVGAGRADTDSYGRRRCSPARSSSAAVIGIRCRCGKSRSMPILVLWLSGSDSAGFIPGAAPGREIPVLPPDLVGRGITLFNIGSTGGTVRREVVSGMR